MLWGVDDYDGGGDGGCGGGLAAAMVLLRCNGGCYTLVAARWRSRARALALAARD